MLETTSSTTDEDTQGSQTKAAAVLRAEFERIAQQMYTQNLALAQTNRTLSILRAIDLLILESTRNLSELSADISQAIIDASSYAIVSIFSLNQHNEEYLSFQGLADNLSTEQQNHQISTLDLFQDLHIPVNGQWVAGKSRNLIIDLSNQDQIDRLALFSSDTKKVFSTLSEQFNVRALYLTKLRARDSLTGVMMIALEEPVPMIDDIELIERVSEPTGIALDNRLLYEENVRVVKQLQQTNDQLKEIDASKDEFISMASHQLRTPLTSMKGYVSMVLEGDVGPISDTQRAMLQQAFDSSQRMVYLIADLLNVSRLRTGKFVILNKVTDLPQVVEDELRQLSTGAKARNVTFNFTKPTDFPKVYLDETKVRQVVMNFLDNALYYTPDGGHVDVNLVSDGKSIRYTVTDTGLGVPKEDQKFLFTKFYRAQNARKMRPDGTGLGLYMARKVIAAQGGALLFSSIEGEGSTFGFSFPLEAVKIPTDSTTAPAEPVQNTNTPQTAEQSVIEAVKQRNP